MSIELETATQTSRPRMALDNLQRTMSGNDDDHECTSEGAVINCDPSKPPKMLWDIDAKLKDVVFNDLGVNELEKKSPSSAPLQHHATPTDNITHDQPSTTDDSISSSPSHQSTPSSIAQSEDHIHNGTSCSCKRRLLDEINSSDLFSCLADEVLLNVFRWLPLKTLSHCSRVCKRFHALVCDESLWRRINLSSRRFASGILGNLLLRGSTAVKLSRAKIEEPVFVQSAERKTRRNGAKISKHSATIKVQYLDLSSSDTSPGALCEIIEPCTQLRKLSLESCQVNVSVLTCVGLRGHLLEELNLSMCEGVIDVGLMKLLQDMPNLKSLNLAWTSLKRPALDVLVSSIPPSLDKLNLSGCRQHLSDTDVEQILFRCPKLRELDLSDTTTLTEAVYQMFIQHGNIQHLAINRCYSLNYTTFVQLNNVKSLKALDVFGLVPEGAIDIVKHQMQGLMFNLHPFCAIARPTFKKKNTIWGVKCHD